MSEQNQQPKPQREQTYITSEMQKVIDEAVDRRLQYARPMRFHKFHVSFGMIALPVWYALSCISYSWVADGFTLGNSMILNIIMFVFLIVYCSIACKKVRKFYIDAYKSAIIAAWLTYGAWVIGMVLVVAVLPGIITEVQQLILQTLPLGFTQMIIPICVTVYYNHRKEFFTVACTAKPSAPITAPEAPATPIGTPEPKQTKYDALSDDDKKIADALIEQLANRKK